MEQASKVRRAFGDLLALYDLGTVDGRALVDAAAELLVVDIDGPAMTELACMVVSPTTSPFETDAVIAAARLELGMPALDRDGTAKRATQGQLRRWRAGLLSDREVAAWAHQAIGHDGDSDLQDLVVIDDLLDGVGWTDASAESINTALQAIAITCLADADPWA